MIVDKNKFKESYNELYSSRNNIFPDSIFTFTTNFTSTHFESILQVNDSRLHNISFLSNKSKKFKLLSIGKIKNYTIEDFSKGCINKKIEEIIKTNISINDTSQEDIPFILCGQNFDLSKKNTGIWNDIPSLNYWVPEILLYQNNYNTTLTHLFTANTSLDDIIANIENNHEFIYSILDSKYPDKHANNIISSNKFLTDKDTFDDSIANIKNNINNSKVSKVVISNILSCEIDKELPYSNLIMKLNDIYPTCCVFYYRFNGIQSFIGASPETILKKEDDIIKIDSLAGSKPIVNKEDLLNDSKIKNEHEFVTKGIIDSLKRIDMNCEIKKSYILELKNIAHLKTEIITRIDKKDNPLNVLDTLVPTPALSGYPKHASLDIINSIEENERGWYAGPIGWIDSNMNCEFFAALRSAYINKNKIYFYGGAGIVINSETNEEWDEIENKINSIYNIING